MTHVKGVEPEELDTQLKELLAGMGGALGVVPESLRVMAHVPDVLEAFCRLVSIVHGTPEHPRRVPTQLLWMAGHMASVGSGCRYCQAHTVHFAVERTDLAPEK